MAAAATAFSGSSCVLRTFFLNTNQRLHFYNNFLLCVPLKAASSASAACKIQSFFSPCHTFSHPNGFCFPSLSPSYCYSSLASPCTSIYASQSEQRRANVVEILEERGLLESITSDVLGSTASDPLAPPLRVYCGFDPTAESLHLGNLLGLVVLSWFIRCGHRAVALIGGATGRVGDPSGKSIERPELDTNTLDRNAAAISSTIRRIINVPPSSFNFEILNNYDWWKDVKLLDFLRDVGRYARVGSMMSKDSVRKRLESEQGLSFTEFTYQLLQGYDFLHLFRSEGVNVQIGGSDQWGNITAGTDLIRRLVDGKAYGLTFSLLLKSDGTKFGKSEDGAIWLSPSLLSPYKFYQYFFSVLDSDVVRFLKMLTFLSLEEIGQIEMDMQKSGYVPNTAQRRLAEEITHFVHGQQGLDVVLKATEALRPGAETKLDSKAIEGIARDIPSYSLLYNQVFNLSLVDLSVSIGLLDSKSAARRIIKQGGLYLNNCRVDNEAQKIEANDIVDGKILLLSAGKKNKMVVFSSWMHFSAVRAFAESMKLPFPSPHLSFFSSLLCYYSLIPASNIAYELIPVSCAVPSVKREKKGIPYWRVCATVEQILHVKLQHIVENGRRSRDGWHWW